MQMFPKDKENGLLLIFFPDLNMIVIGKSIHKGPEVLRFWGQG